GHDYFLKGAARWLPPAPLSTPVVQGAWGGAVGMAAFLEWARGKNAFRFVPDLNSPSFFVDGCYLENPLHDPPTVESDGTMQVQLELRNPSIDMGNAFWRNVMFDYGPG